MPVQGSTIIDSETTQEAVCPPRASSPSLEVNLIEVLTQLVWRKWLIARITGIAMASGLLLSLLLPVRYTAATRLMPPQQSPSSASILMNEVTNSAAGTLSAMAGGALGLKNPNDIYVGLLNSRPVADAIIQRFGLVSVYHATDMTAARKKLAEHTEIVSEKAGFISVSVTDKDKQRAAGMANAYTDELRTLTKTLAVTEASQRRLFYEEQLKQAKEALVSAALAFQQIQQSKGLVQLDAQAKAMIEGVAALQAQIAARQVEVQALRSWSTENNPEVQLAEGRLSTLQAEAAHLEKSNHGVGFSNMGLEDVPGAGLEYLRADHELRYRQALMDMLMKQYDAARLDEARDAAVIQVVEPAIAPDRRSSPPRGPILIAFTVLGLLSGCMVAVIAWWKELLQSDPVAVWRLEQLRMALTGRRQ